MQTKSDAYYLGRAYAACRKNMGEDAAIEAAARSGELGKPGPEQALVLTVSEQEALDFRAGFRSLAGV